MKVEMNLDKLERNAIQAFLEHERDDDRVALGKAYAYTELLANFTGLSFHKLVETLSTRADKKLEDFYKDLP